MEFIFSRTVLLLVSCTSRPVSPSKASRRAIDTIFQQKVTHAQATNGFYLCAACKTAYMK